MFLVSLCGEFDYRDSVNIEYILTNENRRKPLKLSKLDLDKLSLLYQNHWYAHYKTYGPYIYEKV